MKAKDPKKPESLSDIMSRMNHKVSVSSVPSDVKKEENKEEDLKNKLSVKKMKSIK
jgi:hypothetical protein